MVDGQFTEVDGAFGNTSMFSNFTIGSDGDLFWPGVVDDISLFTSALTKTQLVFLYGGGAGRRYPWDGNGAQLLLQDGGHLLFQNDGSLNLN